MCLVFESLTATMGNWRMPSLAIALRRMTPVVVSSVEPRTLATSAFRSAWLRVSTHFRIGGARSSSRLSAIMWSEPTRSAPSSWVMSGPNASAAAMWP